VYREARLTLGDIVVDSRDPDHLVYKSQWLQNVARAEWNHYVGENRKHGYHGLAILLNNNTVGGIMYRLSLLHEEAVGPKSKLMYVAYFFIHPRFQRNGYGSYWLGCKMKELYPQCRRLELLTRPQNSAACKLYFDKLGFQQGGSSLVARYGYDPRPGNFISAYVNGSREAAARSNARCAARSHTSYFWTRIHPRTELHGRAAG
jgi:ribosomal protein S18 acetylase RimI-like enzyme